MQGQLFVIEGTDGSGKKTQSELLVAKLNESGVLKGKSAHLLSFPNYEGPWGQLVRQYLTPPNDSLEGLITPMYAAILYAADRSMEVKKIRDYLDAGDIIICDRYTPSNLAHQTANVPTRQQKAFRDWLEDLEYNILDIPRETAVIFLTLPAEMSQSRSQERRQTERRQSERRTGQVAPKDRHEDSQSHLSDTHDQFLRLAKERSWHIVNCVENGQELSREAIAYRIWQEILPYLL